MIVDQKKVRKALEELDGERALRQLLERELGYDYEGGLISTDELPAGVEEEVAAEPTLIASTARDGRFTVIHIRLTTPGKLSLTTERRIMERLKKSYPYSLFVFSDSEDRLWHFVNAPLDPEAQAPGHLSGRKQYRRVVVGPGERFRTATERISLLSVNDLAEKSGQEPEDLAALAIHAAHDEAFDVEAVTKEFFREYARVFNRVEALVEGVADAESKRLFTQRLFNRLMFLAFIQKKDWLTFDGSTDYLPALWEDYGRDEAEDKNFYRDRLKLLFFAGLNTPNEVDVAGINDGGYLRELIGTVPYLNGGLFERNEVDNDDAVFVPDEAVRVILMDLFTRFNFTVTESTPLDVEVAVDPEMLGRVFEELVTGRHETGSYYTPKPVVSFMCREALKGHLGAKLPNDEPGAIGRFVEEHDSSGLRDPEGALESLRSVSVCDPACGSGAYLLGMLHELLDLRASLFAARNLDALSDYNRKLEIIQRNLYGVDKDEFAVNIARLRLWLSLVVDFEGEEDQKPPPLPNLDFKIETGDSLTAPDPSGGLEPNMVRDEQVSRLEGMKATFLEAHGEEKRRLRREIKALQDEISEWAHPDGAVSGFDWQVEFAEVFAPDADGNAGGFEVVLANPPYVRQELIKPLKPKLKEVFPEVYTGTSDLYVYFYARALQLLRPGGMIAFISSNKWFRANYGKKLREHIANTTHVTSITDFGDLPVFQGASAYPMIFTAQKDQNAAGDPTVLTQVKSLAPPYPDVAALVRAQGSPLSDDSINGPDWSLTDVETAARLKKMRAAGVPLGEYVKGQIYRGVLTGFNKAFVIDGSKREELISQDPNSAEIIKPFAVGKDVRKWTVDYKDRWLIVTPIGVDIGRYPAIFEHLKQWQPELEKRYDKGKHWWELRACDYYPVFEETKILFPDIAKRPRFAFDTVGVFTNDTTFVTPNKDFYLLGLLNSSIIENFFIELGATVRGGYLRFKTLYVEQIPVPNAPAADREAIAELVQKCLDARGVGCEEWESEIDERVAALYGLSEGG